MSTVTFDADLIRRYEGSGPRYTSYPTAVQFTPAFGPEEYRKAVHRSNEQASADPLSLYVHVPFCATPCFYCGCNRVITRSRERAREYLSRLHREVEMQCGLFGRARRIEQLHFGGGTPTFLDNAELAGLLEHMDRHFALTTHPGREYSIEIDPRTVTPESVHGLAALGFNRMSLGVQDFDPAVQAAVNRIQPQADTLRVVDAARAAGVASVSFDLIYGLPRQTLQGFARTLDAVVTARPDRLAVYAYAHMPRLFKAQRRIKAEDLPSPELRLQLLGLTVQTLTEAGYEYIGMDHFALPGDELVRAKRDRTLQRNFQGYSTRADYDLVALGVSSIGKVADTYAQNYKTLVDYYAAIDAGRLAVQRGVRLTRDDVIRRAAIQELMCHERLDTVAFGQRFDIRFKQYFASELERLQLLQADGLTAVHNGCIVITEAGRLLMRNIAMTFDAYLAPKVAEETYSKVI